MINRFLRVIKENKTESFIHFILLILFFMVMESGLGSSLDSIEMNRLRMNFLAIPIIFYLNTYFLIPKFLKPKKWFTYFFIVLFMSPVFDVFRTLLTMFVLNNTDNAMPKEFRSIFFGSNSISGGVFLGFLLSFAYRFTKDWLINLTLIEKLKTERSEMKLAYLKSQVNPHFLFNTLNSLYSLALEENSAKTADGIAKLGTLMRYNLHDSQAETIPLNKEIEYIQKYVGLQKLRITKMNTVRFVLKINKSDLYLNKISPMLLMPIIENSFKYGVSPSEKTRIFISIEVENKNLTMDVENTIISSIAAKESSGVGINNLQERLQMLYPNKYKFNFSKNENVFKTHLELELI